MSRKSNKKKKSNPLSSIVALKPENFIVKKGRSLPIYECRMIDGWFEGGKNQVLIVRRLPNNNFVVGFFLIDLWCLGLKDSFFRYDLTKFDYNDLISTIEKTTPSAVIPAAKAFNLIYAAIEYAEDLGFEPSKEFKVTQYLLDDVDDIEYEEIETGLNGMPCYYPGPDDNVMAVLKKLDKNVGKGNYTFKEFASPEDYDMDGPSKSEIVEQFFPQKKLDKKLATLKSIEDKTNFMMQVIILTLALEMAGGDLKTLEEEYDDDFLEDLLEEFKLEMEDMRKKDGLPPMEPSEELENTTLVFVNIIVQQAILHGNVEFMFEEDYQPISKTVTPENLMDIPHEHFEDFISRSFKMMNDDQKEMVFFKIKTMRLVEQMLLDDPELELKKIDEEKLLREAVQAMLELNENGYWENPNPQLMAECHKSVLDVIDSYTKEK
jgi:hypothetical protein